MEPTASRQRMQADPSLRDSEAGSSSQSGGLQSSSALPQPPTTPRKTIDSGPGLVELDGSIMEGVGVACMSDTDVRMAVVYSNQ